MTTLVLSAFGVHTGGGRVLLDALVAAAGARLRLAYLDARYAGALHAATVARRVAPAVLPRLRALAACAREARADEVLLAFNSLPPSRRSAARTVTYVHAPYIAGPGRSIAYDRRTALRQRGERWLFARGLPNTDAIWVQTPTMADALRAAAPGVPVEVAPFTARAWAAVPVTGHGAPPGRGAYFYPADGVAHKNHVALLRAWALLALAGERPTLETTLTPEVFAARVAEAGTGTMVNVINRGPLPHAAVLERLTDTTLIFPSLAETFGLPLLEAAAAGAPIIASERDFVRDMCVPAQTFDPGSPRSIADAVLRHLGVPRATAAPMSAAVFVERLLG